jgi:Mrp family chromosome partitioning ATPase
MAAMDFRGAVLRGWRLLVLLGLVGALVGFFSVPAQPASESGVVAPTAYRAATIVAPGLGRNSISLARLFLDLKLPGVLSSAAQTANVGVPASKLSSIVGVENGRAALGLSKKQFRGLHIKALGVVVVWYNPQKAEILANSVATAVAKYINQQAQASYASNVQRVANAVAALQTKIATVDGEISGAGSANASLPLLNTQHRVLAGQLQTEVKQQVQLQVSGPKVPGYAILRTAQVIPIYVGHLTVASVVSHRSTRILGGLAVGLVLAIGIILLVEVLDRSLRTVRATEEAFDLPVVGEIPARGSVRPSLQRAAIDTRLAVVVDPDSAAAEAYRRLHTAVLLEPLAADLALLGNGYTNGNGFSYANGNGNGNGHAYANGNGNGHGNGNGNGNGNGHGNGNGNGHGNGHGTERNGGGGLALPSGYPADPANGGDLIHEGNGRKSGRQVVLVVSPAAEVTRSAVVANLAAVYAEAGARALVVSMGDLRVGRGSHSPMPEFEADGEIDPEELVPLSTPSPVEGVSRLRFDQLLASRGQVVTHGPAIITAARDVADAVLIDAPSLLRTHDAIALLPAVDVVLVVAQYAVTRSDEAREAGDMLRRFRAPVLGVVFTNVPSRERQPRGDDTEPDTGPDAVALDGFDTPQPTPAATAKLWL